MSEYKSSITLKKGGTHFLNIISSTAFSSLLVILAKEIFDKDFKIGDIQAVIENISGAVLFVTPVVSSGVRMLVNFFKNK